MNQDKKKKVRNNLRIFLTLLCVYIVILGAIAYPIKMAIPEEGLKTWVWILIVSGVVVSFIVIYLLLLYFRKKKGQ